MVDLTRKQVVKLTDKSFRVKIEQYYGWEKDLRESFSVRGTELISVIKLGIKFVILN